MKKHDLVKRVAELQAAVDQSLANHHALLGRLGEAKFILEELMKLAKTDEDKEEEPVVGAFTSEI